MDVSITTVNVMLSPVHILPPLTKMEDTRLSVPTAIVGSELEY